MRAVGVEANVGGGDVSRYPEILSLGAVGTSGPSAEMTRFTIPTVCVDSLDNLFHD